MLVTPYGDPQAHGTISKTMTFIRRRGIVYARPYIVPRDPRSAGQVTQRQLFSDAVTAWQAESTASKAYFDNASIGQSYTGFNLYVSMFMLGTLPSTTPLMVGTITTADITTVRASASLGWKYRFSTTPSAINFGRIHDNQNTYVIDSTASPTEHLKLIITDEAETIGINFKDTVDITVDGSPLTIYLPAVSGVEETLFIADDGPIFDRISLFACCMNKCRLTVAQRRTFFYFVLLCITIIYGILAILWLLGNGVYFE